LGERTFAGTHGNGRDAPLAVIRGTADPANFAPTAAEELILNFRHWSKSSRIAQDAVAYCCDREFNARA